MATVKGRTKGTFNTFNIDTNNDRAKDTLSNTYIVCHRCFVGKGEDPEEDDYRWSMSMPSQLFRTV